MWIYAATSYYAACKYEYVINYDMGRIHDISYYCQYHQALSTRARRSTQLGNWTNNLSTLSNAHLAHNQ